jgi:hypothetical protein
MRNAVYSLLKDDSTLKQFGVERVYMSPTLDAPRENRFVVLRWGERRVEFGNVAPADLTVWVHSRDADYHVITGILNRIRVLLTAVQHRQGSDGILSQVKWTGDGADLRDNGFQTYVKTSSYLCNAGVSSEA